MCVLQAGARTGGGCCMSILKASARAGGSCCMCVLKDSAVLHAMGIGVNVIAISVDVMAISVNVMAISVDVMAISVDVTAISVDVMAISVGAESGKVEAAGVSSWRADEAVTPGGSSGCVQLVCGRGCHNVRLQVHQAKVTVSPLDPHELPM